MAAENKNRWIMSPVRRARRTSRTDLIVQAHEWGKYVGRADFEFRNGEMKMVNYQLIPVNLKKKVTGKTGKVSTYFTPLKLLRMRRCSHCCHRSRIKGKPSWM